MPRGATPAEAIAAVVAVAALAAAGRTTWVGVDGPGGAGKTTLADAIARSVPAAVVVHVDDFSGPQFDEWDWGRLREQLLLPLESGRDARYQIWDWDRDHGGDWVAVEPGGIVVVEGVSSTRREVAAPWALTIWVDTPPAARQARAIARDGIEIWRTRWVPHWNVTENAYIERERPRERVDLIVRGDDPTLGADR
jgi:uridine kinase